MGKRWSTIGKHHAQVTQAQFRLSVVCFFGVGLLRSNVLNQRTQRISSDKLLTSGLQSQWRNLGGLKLGPCGVFVNFEQMKEISLQVSGIHAISRISPTATKCILFVTPIFLWQGDGFDVRSEQRRTHSNISQVTSILPTFMLRSPVLAQYRILVHLRQRCGILGWRGRKSMIRSWNVHGKEVLQYSAADCIHVCKNEAVWSGATKMGWALRNSKQKFSFPMCGVKPAKRKSLLK